MIAPLSGRVPASIAAALFAISAACALPPPANPYTASPGTTGATVLTSEDLGTASSSLLSALRSRVRGMQVQDSADSDCPSVTFRGANSIFGDNNALVYLDGVRTTNTCVLTTMTLPEVDHVEVYSAGNAPRPPYQSNPNGLILVFTKNLPN